MNSYPIPPEGYLQQIVEIQKDYGDIPAGSIGLCTADLDDVFAVYFQHHGWISFKDKDIRNKFKILPNT